MQQTDDQICTYAEIVTRFLHPTQRPATGKLKIKLQTANGEWTEKMVEAK